MDLGYAVFKGVLQGLTEFLPVSSTAHLILTDHIWGRLTGYQPAFAEAEFFDILLHLGTLSALLLYYRGMLAGVFSGKTSLVPTAKKPLWILLGVSAATTVIWTLLWLKGSGLIFKATGLAAHYTAHLHQPIDNLSDLIMAYPTWVAIHLLVTGTLLFWTERQTRQKTRGQSADVDIPQSTAIGAAQGVAAIFHGISRSGSTICAGLLCGLDRVTATQYSFLLSIPTFILAAVYEFTKFNRAELAHLDWTPMLIGTAFSAVVGYLCIQAFLSFVGRYSLNGFAYYCWSVGFIMLISFGIFH